MVGKFGTLYSGNVLRYFNVFCLTWDWSLLEGLRTCKNGCFPDLTILVPIVNAGIGLLIAKFLGMPQGDAVIFSAVRQRFLYCRSRCHAINSSKLIPACTFLLPWL